MKIARIGVFELIDEATVRILPCIIRKELIIKAAGPITIEGVPEGTPIEALPMGITFDMTDALFQCAEHGVSKGKPPCECWRRPLP